MNRKYRLRATFGSGPNRQHVKKGPPTMGRPRRSCLAPLWLYGARAGGEPVLRVQPYYSTPGAKAKPLKTGIWAQTTGQIVRREPDKVSAHGAIIVDS